MKTGKTVCPSCFLLERHTFCTSSWFLCKSSLPGPDARTLYKRNHFLVFLRCVSLEIWNFTEITDFTHFHGILWNSMKCHEIPRISQKSVIFIEAATSSGAARAPETLVFL